MTDLYWITGPWKGRLAIAARPRGGDWLADELASWGAAGINTVVSLLTPDERKELELDEEAHEAGSRGLAFRSVAIPDRSVPMSDREVENVIRKIAADLAAGKGVVIHCRQGIGRSSLIAAALLAGEGLDLDAALRTISKSRGVSVPETEEQKRWLEEHVPPIVAATK